LTGERTNRQGGTHVSGRTGFSVDRGIIRSLVRRNLRVLVCGQAAAQLHWEGLVSASLPDPDSDVSPVARRERSAIRERSIRL
jgi:hypothetical protein